MSDHAEFSFTIKFARGRGDPRRVFDSASRLIEGFEDLDDTIAQSIDAKLRTTTVLDDVEAGSLRVILRTILENIDDQGLKEGEWKKAIGPALVKGKHLAIEALNRDGKEGPKAIEYLRVQLDQIVQDTGVKHLPAYAPIHEGKLVASLDKIQDAKRTLGPNDDLIIETEGKTYVVDLTKTWEPAEVVPFQAQPRRRAKAPLFSPFESPISSVKRDGNLPMGQRTFTPRSKITSGSKGFMTEEYPSIQGTPSDAKSGSLISLIATAK
jgi:hypothetical protein